MESVLIDQDVNPKKSVVVNKSGSYEGGFMTRTQSSFPSYASASQLFLSVNAGSGGNTASFGLFGSRPPPSRHSSLPSFPATPSVISPSPPFPPLIPQPPLLPLPFSKSATLPSPTPTKRIATVTPAVTTARSRDNRKKTKPAGNTRKEARSSSTASVRSDPVKGESVSVVPQKPAQKPSDPPAAVECEDKVEEGEKEREEGFAMESVYSLSPPPSSLPLPTFFLKRRKAAATAASCIAEAMGCGDAGGGGGGVNPGATDDLLRLLRL